MIQSRRAWPVAGLVVVLSLLFGGFFGVAIAVVALARERKEPRASAFAAAGCVLLAGLASLVPWPTAGSLGLDFAERRHLAAGFGLATAILLTVAAAGAATADRVSGGKAERPRGAHGDRLTPRMVGDAVVVGGATVLALAVRLVTAPAALPPGYGPVVDSIVRGWGLRTEPAEAASTAFHPPLTAFLAAVAPGSAGWTLVVVSALVAGACSLLALRLGGPVAGVIAGFLAAVMPSFWGQQLPESAATLAVLVVILLARPGAWNGARATGAGVSAGMAALARPETLVVLLVVAAWVILDRSARRGWLVTFLAGFALVYAPWQMHVARTFGVLRPSLNLGATVAGANTRAAQYGDLRGSWDLRGVFDSDLAPPEAFSPDEVERDRALFRSGIEHASWSAAPVLAPARVLRGWELWSPVSAARAREGRGLPYSGGLVGGFVEAIVSVVGISSLLILRRQWRSLLPLIAIPALFTVQSALLFGDRGLRSWSAPMAVLGIALVGANAIRSRRPALRSLRHRRPGERSWLARDSVVVFAAMSLTNLAAYGYHVLLSRSLGPARYGTLGALLALGIVASVPSAGLQYAVARRVALDPGGDGLTSARGAATFAGGASLLGFLAVLAGSPLIARFLHADVQSVLWLGAWLIPLALTPVFLGYLQGLRRFWWLSGAVLAVGVTRVGLAALVSAGGFGIAGGVAAMALASLASVLVALPACRGILRASHLPRGLGREITSNALPFLSLSIIAALDVVLARHYLDASQAGYYAAAAIAGKIVLWAPAALAMVAFPDFATSSPGDPALRRTIALAGSVCLTALAGMEIFQRPLVGGLFGSEFLPSSGVLALIALAMTCLAIVQVQVTWAIGHRFRRITLALGCSVAMLGALLVVFHGSPRVIATDLLITCSTLLAVTTLIVRQEVRRVAGR